MGRSEVLNALSSLYGEGFSLRVFGRRVGMGLLFGLVGAVLTCSWSPESFSSCLVDGVLVGLGIDRVEFHLWQRSQIG